MKDALPSFETHLAGLEPDPWLDRLEDVALEHGEFEPLGPDHSVAFIDSGPRLIVTFQEAEEARSSEFGEPLGFGWTRSDGWSSLNFICNGPTWFRHRAIYAYVDRLVDDGFFEEFDEVLFYGVGPAGYAACAYSVAAPGARVLAIRPQATLSARLAGWDPRFMAHRKLDFESRYGYAPAMIDGVEEAFIVFDPYMRTDAMHAALFARESSLLLRMPLLTSKPERDLARMGILDKLIREAMSGHLSAQSFATDLRARRGHKGYLRRLVHTLDKRGRTDLAKRVCRFACRKRDLPFFVRKLAELDAKET